MPIHYKVIRYPQQMVQMAFCDLSPTFHKQVTNFSQHVFVILLWGILTSPHNLYIMFHILFSPYSQTPPPLYPTFFAPLYIFPKNPIFKVTAFNAFRYFLFESKMYMWITHNITKRHIYLKYCPKFIYFLSKYINFAIFL